MPLDLPDGTACLLDSNILYYTLVPTPGVSEHCLSLIDRIIAGHISASVSVPILCEAVHKVMISEAAQLTGRDRAGIVGYLNKHPEIITQLVEYPLSMERLSTISMNVLPIDAPVLQSATQIAVQHGLLTNDAMMIALMQRNQLTHLVTNDDDFDAVPGLRVWQPR